MDNILTRAKDRIRISIRRINFVSEHGGKVNVAAVDYNLQDKNQVKIIDPQSGQPVHQIQVFKQATESIDTMAEPLLEDLLYINKAVMEIYLANTLGLDSEAMAQGFNTEKNQAFQLLLSLAKGASNEGEQANIFDELTKRDPGKIKSPEKEPTRIPKEKEEKEAPVVGSLTPENERAK